MKIRFEMKTEFSEKDPHIVIQAAQLTDQAREVMEYLEQFSITSQVVIPIRTDDHLVMVKICLLYTSPSPRDVEESRMPSSA